MPLMPDVLVLPPPEQPWRGPTVRAARKAMGLTQSGLGSWLCLEPKNADWTVRSWERWEGEGKGGITGPARRAIFERMTRAL